MSDSRSISGTVKVQQHDSVATCALTMARDLWWEEKKSHPKMSDGKFLDLVRYCALALQGHSLSPGVTYAQRISAVLKDA